MKKFTPFFVLILFTFPLMASAAAATPNSTVEGLLGGNMSGCEAKNCIPDLLNGLFTFGLSVGAMLAVLRIAYAGWLYMGSADMWSKKGEGIAVFQDAILGLLLLLGVWLILFQINPDILNLDFTRSFGGGSAATP